MLLLKVNAEIVLAKKIKTPTNVIELYKDSFEFISM